MRALLINPSMPPSFWTFAETCRLHGNRTLLPPLGLITWAALLPEDWEFRLADLSTRSMTEEDWEWSDLVMITGMIVQKESLLALIREAKIRGKTVVVGGPYATSVPGEVLDAGTDFLIRGEAENTASKFLSALHAGQTSGVFEAEKKPAMETSPVPRFDLLAPENYAAMALQTSRGCPFDCEFCDIVNLYGRLPRYKSPDQIIRELEIIFRLGWRRDVFICDDNFIGNRKHATKILDELTPWMKSHGEPFSFWAQTSLNLGADPEMIDRLTEANFSYVFIGIESPDTETLILNRKFQNVRNSPAEAIRTIRQRGLTPLSSFVIGFDNEKKGTGEGIVSFVQDNDIPMAMLNTLQVLPNTSLWDRLKKEGRLLEERTGGNTTGGRLNYVPSRPEAEIMQEYLEACQKLYEPSAYLQRTYRHYMDMRPTRRALGIEEPEAACASTSGVKGQSFRATLNDLRALLRFIWKHGIVPRYRLQFWKQLVGVYLKNPSRMKQYLYTCLMGENVFGIPEDLRKAMSDSIRMPDRSIQFPLKIAN